jgi:hypothetical protein
MKTTALFAAFVATACAMSAAAPVPPKGFRALFNGQDLSGWYGWNPHTSAKLQGAKKAANLEQQRAEFSQHWRAEKGELVNAGTGPYATTTADFGDIELLIEYKTVAKADSGIYLRGTPQVQIWDTNQPDDAKRPDRRPRLGSGGLFNNTAGAPGRDPLVKADKPFGEWNAFRIRQIGARTWVWLNGKLVVDGAVMENYWDRTQPLPAKGPIMLQTHGGEIRWRNIFILELTPAESLRWLQEKQSAGYEPLFNGRDFTGWLGATDSCAVVDGAMVWQAGKGGTVYYKEPFTNFSARLQFKVPPGGNNGLAIRYPGEGDTAYSGMCELQVLDEDYERVKGAKLDARQVHGSAYGMTAAARGYQFPVGEWNFQEVTVTGSTIRVELNGTVILNTDLSQVNEYMAGKAHPGKTRTSGFFGFAGHNDPVAFRYVTARQLP